jgi:hypothetical protein
MVQLVVWLRANHAPVIERCPALKLAYQLTNYLMLAGDELPLPPIGSYQQS